MEEDVRRSDGRTPHSGGEAHRSDWWYGVAIPAGLTVIGWFLLKLIDVFGTGQPTGLDGSIALLGGAIPVVIGWLLLPVFAIRRLWLGVAVLHLLGVFALPVLVMIPAGIVYLHKRHKYLGTP